MREIRGTGHTNSHAVESAVRIYAQLDFITRPQSRNLALKSSDLGAREEVVARILAPGAQIDVFNGCDAVPFLDAGARCWTIVVDEHNEHAERIARVRSWFAD